MSDFHISSEIKITVSLYHCVADAGEVLGLSVALQIEIYRKNREWKCCHSGDGAGRRTELGPVS